MKSKELLELHHEFTAKMFEITKSKNHDYAGHSEDALANFKSVESVGVKTAQGFLTRMMDKMGRLGTFAKLETLEVKDESAEDTCIDLANYSFLLYAYIKNEKLNEKNNCDCESCSCQSVDGNIPVDDSGITRSWSNHN